MSKIWITSKNEKKIFNGGYLGSRDDEERSEMRYAMRIAKPRVIRSLNASGGGVKTFMFVSVWKGITHLNAIEVALTASRLLCVASLVKRDGWSSNRRQNEVVTFV